MKPKFKKVMTLLALVSLGVTGLASCGNPSTDGGKNDLIKFTKGWKDEDKLLAGTTYSLEAKYGSDESAKILFSSNAPSVFTMNAVTNTKIDFSFAKEGTYTITASLESDATINSTISLTLEQGKVSYRLEAETDYMETTIFEQGGAINLDGLRVYKTKYVGDNPTDNKVALDNSQYKLYITEGDTETELVDGEILRVAGEFDVDVRSTEEGVEAGTFTITVASRPTYLADQFFDNMTDEYSVFLISEDSEGNRVEYPWLMRTKDYIMSFDSALMGTYGIGFYLDDESYVRQFYLDEENSTDQKSKFIAGKQLYVDGLDSSNNIVRTRINDLSYAKGYFKYTDGTDYTSETFGKEGKVTVTERQTIFSFGAATETQTFISGLVGITELLNYGFTMSSQIAFVETESLGVSALLSIVINIPGGGQTGGTFLLVNGNVENKDIDEFIASKDKVVNESNDKNLTEVFDIIQGNNFKGSDETNFEDGFTSSTDTGYGVYYATPTSYMTSVGYKQSSSSQAQYLKNGVFTIDSTSGTTYEDGKYAYASQTADGSDAQVKLVEDETVFNQYMPKNWPGFTSSTNETATLKGNDYTSQWLLQTLPMAQYKRDSSGKVIVDSEGNPTITGYDYQYRLPGAATALLWCVVSSVTPAYSSLFTGDSLILNVSTDTQYNITDISIVFHGKINESYANGQKMYSSCNILSMSIDTTSVGKTVNPHIQKFIENNKASEQAK